MVGHLSRGRGEAALGELSLSRGVPGAFSASGEADKLPSLPLKCTLRRRCACCPPAPADDMQWLNHAEGQKINRWGLGSRRGTKSMITSVYQAGAPIADTSWADAAACQHFCHS